MMISGSSDDALTHGPAAAPDHRGPPTTRTPTARVTFADLKPLTERLREPDERPRFRFVRLLPDKPEPLISTAWWSVAGGAYVADGVASGRVRRLVGPKRPRIAGGAAVRRGSA